MGDEVEVRDWTGGAPAAARATGDVAAAGKQTRVAARSARPGAGAPRPTPTIDDVATVAVEDKQAGRSIDGGVAAQVGAHLGRDFSGVQIHDDPTARAATSAMGARAFAYGGDVFLGPGETDRDLGLMAHELTHVAQQGAAATRLPQRQVTVGASDAPAERQADAVAAQVTGGGRPAGLLVDDAPVTGGQMLKSAFLDQLRAQVSAAANEEMGPIGSMVGCPYIDRYFGRYANQPAAAGEALLHRYAPATAQVTTAAAMIPIIVARVREGVRSWRDTGKPPLDLAAADPPATAAAEQASPAAEAAAADPRTQDVASAPDSAAIADDGTAAAMGTAQLQRALGPSAAADARTAQIADLLGAGDVHVHTGPAAARLASAHDAAAFTVGDHVVFGAGEYQPGTVEGDALIAHEVAHVAQQRGAPGAMRAASDEAPAPADHETDADRAAGGVLRRLYDGARSGVDVVRAQLRAPIGMQRCTPNDKDKDKAKANAKDKAKGPEIDNTADATGKHIVDGMHGLNSGGDLTRGVYYHYRYRELCRDQGRTDLWKDDYANGYADPAYWTRTGYMSWQLKTGVSASEGIKSWLKGLTIAECKSTVRILQTDAIRAAVGDDRFDQLFGPTKGTPEKEILTIGLGDVTVTKYRKDDGSGVGTKGNRPAQVGGQYYFYNHPKYLLKHPGGAWQGENALFIGTVGGVQKWSGFGANDVSEKELLDEMRDGYNRVRNEDDDAVLARIKANSGGTLPSKYDPKSGEFPDTISSDDIEKAPAYKIGDTTRKGGYQGSGLVLDLAQVGALKK